MSNIGSVYYKKGIESGTLDAVWSHLTDAYGTGIATGGPLKGFEGVYQIRYFDHEGKINAERERSCFTGSGSFPRLTITCCKNQHKYILLSSNRQKACMCRESML